MLITFRLLGMLYIPQVLLCGRGGNARGWGPPSGLLNEESPGAIAAAGRGGEEEAAAAARSDHYASALLWARKGPKENTDAPPMEMGGTNQDKQDSLLYQV